MKHVVSLEPEVQQLAHVSLVGAAPLVVVCDRREVGAAEYRRDVIKNRRNRTCAQSMFPLGCQASGVTGQHPWGGCVAGGRATKPLLTRPAILFKKHEYDMNGHNVLL